MKYRQGQTKYILRQYLSHNAPQQVSRRPKQGFTVPIAAWLTTALKDWANTLLDPAQLAADGLFDPTEVRRLWHDHQTGRANHVKPLWTLILFQYWLHTVYAGWKTRR